MFIRQYYEVEVFADGHWRFHTRWETEQEAADTAFKRVEEGQPVRGVHLRLIELSRHVIARSVGSPEAPDDEQDRL